MESLLSAIFLPFLITADLALFPDVLSTSEIRPEASCVPTEILPEAPSVPTAEIRPAQAASSPADPTLESTDPFADEQMVV